MKFKYHKYGLPHPFSKNKKLHRPLISLSLKHKEKSLYYEALIDSGSDFNIFPIELAEILGINLQDNRKIYFSGIESNLNEGFISSVSLRIGVCEINTEVVFSNGVGSHGILGQYGFFDKFKVSFDLDKKEIEIKPRKI